MSNFNYKKILIIGLGLIGSSLARAIRKHKLCSELYGIDSDNEVLVKCQKLFIINRSKIYK